MVGFGRLKQFSLFVSVFFTLGSNYFVTFKLSFHSSQERLFAQCFSLRTIE